MTGDLRHNFFMNSHPQQPFMKRNPDHTTEAEALHITFDTVMNAPDAFVAIDYNLKFLFVNALAEKFYNKKKSQLIGSAVNSVFPEESRFGPFKNMIRHVSAKKQFEISYESPYVKQWVKLVGRPFENYYTFTYTKIDYKEMLKAELRKEMRRKK